MVDLLGLLGDVTELQRKASTQGGEFAGACPFCGGTDRFRVWPYRERPGWWCRQCQRHGDTIDFLRQYSGLSYAEACMKAGVNPRDVRTDAPRVANLPAAPSQMWRRVAEDFVELAQRHLWGALGADARDYLRGRGLHDDTIRRWNLGYNHYSRLIDPVQWGLDHSEGRWMALPVGIVIPNHVGHDIWSVKIRKLPPDDDPKYVLVRGSRTGLFGSRTLTLPGEPRRTAVVVEGELDALLLDQQAGDVMAVVTFGSAYTRPTPNWLWRLRNATSILYVCDLDVPGIAAGQALRKLSARVSVIHPEGGKDITEMFLAGRDVRAWILNSVSPGTSEPNGSV